MIKADLIGLVTNDGMLFNQNQPFILIYHSNIFSSMNFNNDGYRRTNQIDRPSFRNNRNEYIRQDNRNDYFRQDGRNNQSFSRFNRNDNPRRTIEQTTNENSNQWERSTRQ